MLTEENRAILLMAKTKATKDKPMCDSHTKKDKHTSTGGAFVKPDGKAEWVRFKTECVLLKGRGNK